MILDFVIVQFNIVVIMPGLIGIGEFIDETREDYSSPTTSTFVSRMPQCRQTINALEEVSNLKNIFELLI